MATTNSVSQNSFDLAPLGLYGVFYKNALFQDMILGVQGENDGGIFHFMSPQKYQSDLHRTSFESARWVGRLKISEAGDYLFSSSDKWRSCMKIWKQVTFQVSPDVLKQMTCTEDKDNKIYKIPEKTDPNAKNAFRVTCKQGVYQVLKEDNEDDNWNVEIRVPKASNGKTYSGTISYLMQQGDLTGHLEKGIYKIRVEYMPLIPIVANENIFTLYWQTPTILKKSGGDPAKNTVIPTKNLRGPDLSDSDYLPTHITDNLFNSKQYIILDSEEIQSLVSSNQHPETPTNVSYNRISADTKLTDEPNTDESKGAGEAINITLDQLKAMTLIQNRIKQIGNDQNVMEEQMKRWAKARKYQNTAFNVETMIQLVWKDEAPKFIQQLEDSLSILQKQTSKNLISTLRDLIKDVNPQTNDFKLELLEKFISELDTFSKEESTLMKKSLKLSSTVSTLKTTLGNMKELHSSQKQTSVAAKAAWNKEYVNNEDPKKNLDPDYDVTNPHAYHADANNDGITNYNSMHGFTVTPDGQIQPYGMRKDLPTYYCNYRLKSTTGDPFTDTNKLIGERLSNISKLARNPLVAAYPHINVNMVGFQLIPEITKTEGVAKTYEFSVSNSRTDSQTNSTGQTHGTEEAIHGEISISETPSIGGGGSKSWSNSLSNEMSTSNTIEVNTTNGQNESTSFQKSFNTANYAIFNGLITYRNSGTAGVSKLLPTFNLSYHDGNKMEPLVTVKPAKDGGAEVGLLQPDASYPSNEQEGPLVIKSTDAFNANQIQVSQPQFHAILSGRPMSLSLLQYDGYIPDGEPTFKTQWVQNLDKIQEHTAHLTLITPEGDMYDRRIAAPRENDLGYKGINPDKQLGKHPFSYVDIDKAHRLTIGEAITLAFSDDPSQKFVKKNKNGIKYDLQSKNVKITMSRQTKEALKKQLDFAKTEIEETRSHLKKLDWEETEQNKKIENEFKTLQMKDEDRKEWLYNFYQNKPIQKKLETLEQNKQFIEDQIDHIKPKSLQLPAADVEQLQTQLDKIKDEIDKLGEEQEGYKEKMDNLLRQAGKMLKQKQIDDWTKKITKKIANMDLVQEWIQKQRITGEFYLDEMKKTLKKKNFYDYELLQGMRLIIQIPPLVTATFKNATTKDKNTYQELYLKNHFLQEKLKYRIKLRPPSSTTKSTDAPELGSFTPATEKNVFGYKEGVLEPNAEQNTKIPHLSNNDRIEVWIQKDGEKEYNLLISKTVGQIPGFRADKPKVDTRKLTKNFTFQTFKVDWSYPKACNGVVLSIPSPEILKEFLSFILEVTDLTTNKTASYGPVLASEIRKNIVPEKNAANQSCTFDFSLFKDFDMKKNYWGYTFTLKGKLDEAVPSGWEKQQPGSCHKDEKDKMKNCATLVPTFKEPRTIELCKQIFPGKMFSLEQYMIAFKNKGTLSNPLTNQKSKVNGEHVTFNSVYPEFVIERQGTLSNHPLLLAGIKKVTCTFKNTKKTEVITPTDTQFTMENNALHVRFNTKIDVTQKEEPDGWQVVREVSKGGLLNFLIPSAVENIKHEFNKYSTYSAEVDGLIQSDKRDKTMKIQITVDKDILKDNNHEDQMFTIFETKI
ncbi:hypothetical protein COC60_06575 [Bacillus thuringiensis]|uniref:binary toxin-like calcium binding domain-containing protein n=1 Tax=Bacillus cereus group TaxID=86661 RepID=UPI000BF90587|nr:MULTISPECIES: binary toxin-like calcium binding domain-containing protein [Bacillus cereus group]PES78236.1 hypothetical protein CN511_26210 [Bacillus thuringiensis]PEV51279.1 hypothetical protein CN432_08630 [Bacillus thuringiensis]PEV57450.1 hypothetical protein CN422_18195 [Bacillus cereus]PEZ29257.1 hypothetical protein CN346_25200 [Bacillus thuringiensis]PFI82125.1 hypothetical protein COI86_28815 [Bacillus thuringiensis]